MEIDTYPGLLLRNYQKWGNKEVAMRQKDFGIWQNYTWKDEYENIKEISLGLVALGFVQGDKVAILGDCEPEWYWGEMACLAAGGVVVGLFTDSIPSELKYTINDSGVKFVIARDQEQVDKMLLLRDRIPKVQKVIFWEHKGLKDYSDPFLIDYDELKSLGRDYEDRLPGCFEVNINKVKPDDIALLLYTSGTTGLPKGVMVPHKSYITACRSVIAAGLKLSYKDDQMSLFPPAWAAEQMWGFTNHYLVGTKLCFPEETETVLEDLGEISPRLITFGPKQWEMLISTTQIKTNDAAFLKRSLFKLCLPIGYKIADLRFKKKKIGLLWKFLNLIAYWVVFRSLQDRLGLKQAREPWTGGSALSPDGFRFLHAIGVPIKNHYATTETGIVTCQRQDDIRAETLGPPVDGVNIKISNEGEILVGGEHIAKGYYKNSEITDLQFKQGWFHTGDAGFLNEDGHLIYLHRIAELVKLAGGAKFSPTSIEGKLKFSPYIKNVMLVGGETKEYASAMVIIDANNVGKWAEVRHLPYTSFADLSQKPEVAELISREFISVNHVVPELSKVRKFVCLHKEFDPDEAELTRTRKLRRHFIQERYQVLIDAIYQDETESMVEASVTYRDGRQGVIATALKICCVEDDNK